MPPPPGVYYPGPYMAPGPLPECALGAQPSPCVQPRASYRHEGFYLRWGGGVGPLAFSGSGPSGDASIGGGGVAARVAIGGTPFEGIVIAGALSAAGASGHFHGSPHVPEGRANISVVELGALVDWFPEPTGGWHLGGILGLDGLGVANSWLVDSSGGGLGVTAFGGYDWWIGSEWSLGLQAVASATTSASLRDKDGNDTGYRFNALRFGIEYSFTVH